MADWRQIQARIRKARSAPDALAKMTELFERTRDAMVAFELGKLHEKAGANEDAVNSYTVAYERFRRPGWRKKAEEALVRLGAPVPAASAEPAAEGSAAPQESAPQPESPAAPELPSGFAVEEGESQLAFADAIRAQADASAHALAKQGGAPPRAQSSSAAAAPAAGAKRSRRGRRGGRGRRRTGPRTTAAQPPVAPPPVTAPPQPVHREEPPQPKPRHVAPPPPPEPEPEPGPISIEAALAGRAKAGEPALASRSAKLESQLRRLIAAAPRSPHEHEAAPAGPGVLLLSDSDLSTYYYVESCDTLRVALRVLMQGQRGRERNQSVRARLAEHLGISESKVAKYLQEHCAARWLQLDEGASHLAHFAIAMLRPALND